MKNRTAIVTGASRGIGKAIAEEFVSRGYNVAIISRDYEDVKKVSEEFKEYRGRCLHFQCDVRNSKRVRETFCVIYEMCHSLDVLVNNAGVNSRKILNTKEVEEWFDNFKDNLLGWNDEIATNLTGTYNCSYMAAGHMLRQGRGSIINISSLKGEEATSSPGYGASKAGIIHLTKDFAKALAPYIRVNCVAPGFIDTGMTTKLAEDKKEAYRKMIPCGRFGTVEDIAKLVSFLASDDSRYITGVTIDVNGGYLMR